MFSKERMFRRHVSALGLKGEVLEAVCCAHRACMEGEGSFVDDSRDPMGEYCFWQDANRFVSGGKPGVRPVGKGAAPKAAGMTAGDERRTQL